MQPAQSPERDNSACHLTQREWERTFWGPAGWAPRPSSGVPTFSLWQKGEGCGPAAGVKIRKSEECRAVPRHLSPSDRLREKSLIFLI